jgi:TP901 family phage tail tape measure protein
MASATVGILRVLLTVNSAEFERGLAQSKDAVRTYGRELDKVGKQASALGLTLTKALTVPLLGIAGASVKAFADFDDAMVKSTAIMGDLSKEMRGKLETAARDVAKTTTFSAKQAADAYFYLASAGLDATQSIAAMPKVAAFAQAGNFDLARATDLLTDAQSALGLTIRDDVVANMENMTRVSDVLVKANTLANATVEQFSESLTNKAGAALRLVNKDLEEGVAVLAVYADQGVKGAEAGEKLNIVLRDLQTAAIKNGDTFKQFGIEVFDSQGNLRNMADIIAQLETALAGMSDEQRRTTLMMLGFQERSISATAALIGTSDAMRQYETQLRSAGGITQTVAEKQLQSFKAQLSLLWSGLQDVAIEIGGALVPALKGLTSVAQALLPIVQAIAQAFTALPQPIQTGTLLFVGMAAAVGPLTWVFGQLLQGAASITMAFTKKGLATRLLTGELKILNTTGAGLAGTLGKVGLAGVVAALAYGLSDLEARTNKAREAVQQGDVSVKNVTASLGNAVLRGLAPFGAMWRDITEGITLAKAALLSFKAVEMPTAPAAPKLFEDIKPPEIPKDILSIYGQLNQQLREAQKGSADFRAELQKARDEIKALSQDALADLTAAIRSNAFTQDQLKEKYHLSDAALKLLTESVKAHGKEQKTAQKTIEDINKASDEYLQTLERLGGKLQQIGILTETQFTKRMGDLNETLNAAAQQGSEALRRALLALRPEIDALARDSERSGVAVGVAVTEWRRWAASINLTTLSLDEMLAQLPPVTSGIGTLTDRMRQHSVASEVAAVQSGVLTDALKRQGVTSREELAKTARQAEKDWRLIVQTYGKQSREATAAYTRMIEAQRAETGKLPSYWETEVFPRISGVVRTLTDAINGSFAQMLLGAKGFKDGFLDIWNSLKAGVLNILNSILSSFINTFLKGLLGALTGQKGAFQQAFAGLFGGAPIGVGGGGQGGLLGGLLGKIPGLGGLFGGGTAVAGGVGTVTAGLPSVAGIGTVVPVGGTGAAAGAGGAAATGSLLTGLLGGAGAAGGGILLGLLGKELFGGKGAAAGIFGGASGAATGALIGSIVPGIGTAIGALIGGLSGVISGVFGGPSKAQKEARNTVEGFETYLASMLTAQQKLEAGGEGWKETVIAIRDAYIAAGLSEQDALRDAERLWQSAKDGGPTTKKVIEEIVAKMGDLSKTTQEAGDDIADALVDGATEGGTVTIDKFAEIEEFLRTNASPRIQSLWKQMFGNLQRDAIRAASGIEDALWGIEVPQLQLQVNWDLPQMPVPNGGDYSIPGHAAGGVFSRPHLAQIAEGGESEIVGSVPFMTKALTGALERVGLAGGTAGRGGSVNIYAMDSASFEQWLRADPRRAKAVSDAQFQTVRRDGATRSQFRTLVQSVTP